LRTDRQACGADCGTSGDPSLNPPSATALSSSWDLSVAPRYGSVAAAEVRGKAVDVMPDGELAAASAELARASRAAAADGPPCPPNG
jgi:hypothetical protein